jgi:hypothetical protein
MRAIGWRVGIWGLASLSFACLLGTFYGLWPMRAFACWVLAPTTLLLGWIAWWKRGLPRGPAEPGTWIAQGALGGLLAAVAYDLFRLPFVLAGYPLFDVFPRFGQMLLGRPADDFGPLVQIVGWTYHFSNGAALGVMYLAMVSTWTRARLVWGAMAWVSGVEIFLLLTPYYSFFKLAMPFAIFLVLTLSAHLIFGSVLGTWCWLRLGRPALARVGA